MQGHHYHHHHHHHHHVSFMELGHLLTCSSLRYPKVSSNVYHDSFCQMGSSPKQVIYNYMPKTKQIFMVHAYNHADILWLQFMVDRK